MTEHTCVTRTLTVMKLHTSIWTAILLFLCSSSLGIKGYDDDEIYNSYVTYRYDSDVLPNLFTFRYNSDDLANRFTFKYDLNDDIFVTSGYDRNIGPLAIYRNNSSVLIGILVGGVILKILLISCYLVRRQRLRRVTVCVSEPIAVRVTAQTTVNPTASGAEAPYATPYAAHGFPKYPSRVHKYDTQTPYNPNLGQPSAAGQVPPPYEEAAPPSYELPCDRVDVPDNTKLISSTNH